MLRSISDNISLTQNSWTLIDNEDDSRRAIEIENESTSDDAYIAFIENPWELSFDGTNDVITLYGEALLDESGAMLLDETGVPLLDEDDDAFLTALEDDTAGSISAEIELEAVTDTANRAIFSVCEGTGDTYMDFYVDVNGFVNAKCVLSGTTQWHVVTTAKLTTDHHLVKLVHNGIRPNIHVDRNQADINDVVSTDLTIWFSDLAAQTDTAYIGAADVGSGAAEFFQGDIHYVNVASGTNSGTNRVRTKAAVLANWEFTEGTGTGVLAKPNPYVGIVSGATWASYEAGKKIGPSKEWYREMSGQAENSSIWGWTTASGVTVDVLLTSEKRRLRL